MVQQPAMPLVLAVLVDPLIALLDDALDVVAKLELLVLAKHSRLRGSEPAPSPTEQQQNLWWDRDILTNHYGSSLVQALCSGSLLWEFCELARSSQQ